MKRRFNWPGVWYRRPTILTARRRRVLENACAKKRRFNPPRGQRRNFGKVNDWDGCADQWRMSSMIVTARGDHRRCAVVLGAIRVRVDALVQFRGSTQRERPEKCRRNASRDKCTPAICRTRERAHCAATFRLASALRKEFLQDPHYRMERFADS